MKYGFLALFICSFILTALNSHAQNRTGCCDLRQAKDIKAKGLKFPYDPIRLQAEKALLVKVFNKEWGKETKSKQKLKNFDSVYLTLIYLHYNSLGFQTTDTPNSCKKENMSRKSSKERLKKIMTPALRGTLLYFIMSNTEGTDSSNKMNHILEEIIFSPDYE